MMNEIDAQTISKRSKLPVEVIQKTEVGTVSGKARRIGEFRLGAVASSSSTQWCD